MYKDQFDTYLPTHKLSGRNSLSGACSTCGVEVSLDTSMNSIRFIDSFTNSDLCFNESALLEISQSARKWRNIVERFNSGENYKSLAHLSEDGLAEVETNCRSSYEYYSDVISAYVDLYHRTPKFAAEKVENILSPISLV